MDTVLPQIMVEKDKDKQLYDMVQKYSVLVVKFLVNSTPVLLGLNAKQERNYETIALNFYIKKNKTISCSKTYFHLPVVSKVERKCFSLAQMGYKLSL